MSQSHRVIGQTTDEAFHEQCFLWEKGTSVSGALYDILHAQGHI